MPWACPVLVAQEAGADGSSRASTAPVQEELPRGFYLKNEKGDLVYVPDLPYEQFEQLLKIQRNLTNPQRPAFVMKDMVINAVAVGSQLELNVEFVLEGRELEGVEGGTWFRVPLRLSKAFLRKADYSGPGEYFLTFDGNQDGYVCWLQMGSQAIHKVTLALVVPIDRVGDESRCVLSAPTPLVSTLQLRVDEYPVEGSLRDLADDSTRPLAFETAPDGKGQTSARGIRGDVALSWHRLRTAAEQTNIRLDVYGEIIVTADEMLQEVRSDGTFVVRGLGGPVETFRVRLPPGMRLRESPEQGYAVRHVLPEGEEEGASQVVEIRLDRPTVAESRIRLLAEVPSSEDDPSAPLTVSKLVDQSAEFEPARYEFLGAVRHRGNIDFVTNGDWALQCVDDPDFPRVEPGTTAAAVTAVSARYRYHNQQRALRVSVRQKATRISVEPTYDVFVDAQQARLIASLVCKTSGSRAGPLAVRLPGWTVEIVHFAEIDSPLPIDLDETNPLVVPIPMEAQASSRFTLQIEARQDLTASVVSGTAPLRVVLPLVEAENPSRANLIVSPATVTLIPADNILLTPLPQQLQALAPLNFPTPLGGGVSGSPPPGSGQGLGGQGLGGQGLGGAANGSETTVFRYRDRGASEQAMFVGDFRIQPQSISVSVGSTISLDRRSFVVEQRFSCEVLHVAVDSLVLNVPAALVSGDRVGLRILLDDQPLVPTLEQAVGGERVRVRVRFPQPVLGPVELRVVQSRQPLTELAADQSLKVTVPLAFPSTRADSNTVIIANVLTVLHGDPLHVEPAGGSWAVEEGESTTGRLVLTTSTDGANAMLNVSLHGSGLAGSTVVRQAWIQTWITGRQRRDRAVFRVRTAEPRLRVILPSQGESSLELAGCAVDQEQVAPLGPDPNGAIVIPLPAMPDGQAGDHVVEVWYTFSSGRPVRGSMALHAAGVDAADRVERCYWQLILPHDEIVLWGDSGLTPELLWQWGGFGWQRQPMREQGDLEQWIGASRQELIPAQTNRYVFTSFSDARPPGGGDVFPCHPSCWPHRVSSWRWDCS